jgi:CubicO group peptidase (beta-lactamase class C family)
MCSRPHHDARIVRWLSAALVVITPTIAATAFAAGAQPTAPASVAALDRELAAIVDDPAHPLASLAVVVVRDGRTLYQRQFGHRTIDNDEPARSRRADAQTLYRVASISKLVTTLGVLRLVESGLLDLDRDAGDYLGYTLRNPHFPDAPITLRMLLSHASSLRDDAGYYWEAKLGVDLKDVLTPGGARYGIGAMWAANARPGAYFAYSNFAWGVIGTIMERATGERFDRLLKRLVLTPLQLRGGFEPAEFSADDLRNTATLYRKRTEVAGKEVWNPAGPWVAQVDDYARSAPAPRANPGYVPGTNGTLFGPQGNCRLSAAGLATITQMLMQQGRHRGKAFLRPASIDEMLATQWRWNGRRDTARGTTDNVSNGNPDFGSHRESMLEWGLGNQHFVDHTGPGIGDRLVEAGSFTAVGHTGDAWGLRGAMVFDPRRRDGMIFLIGGHGFDPETYPGTYSANYRHEEKILTALHRLLQRGTGEHEKAQVRPRRA